MSEILLICCYPSIGGDCALLSLFNCGYLIATVRVVTPPGPYYPSIWNYITNLTPILTPTSRPISENSTILALWGLTLLKVRTIREAAWPLPGQYPKLSISVKIFLLIYRIFFQKIKMMQVELLLLRKILKQKKIVNIYLLFVLLIIIILNNNNNNKLTFTQIYFELPKPVIYHLRSQSKKKKRIKIFFYWRR